LTQHTNESIKYRNIRIQNELQKYSWKILREFQELFPCKKLYTLEILRSQVSFLIDSSYQSKKLSESYVDYFDIESPNKFWVDWYRYKQLKAFL
jgi:hypothetical protein